MSTRGAKVFIIVALIAVMSVLIPFGIGKFLGGTIAVEVDVIDPIQVKDWGIIVVNEDGKVIGNVNSTTTTAQFIDGTHRYPIVDAGFSQHYRSDKYGNAIAEDANLQPKARLVVNGEVMYYHEDYYTTQFWTRTHYNAEFTVNTNSYLNPFAGMTVSRGGGTGGSCVLKLGGGAEVPANERLPYGCLAGILDTGVAPWSGTYQSGAMITCGIVPIDYPVGNNPIRANYTLTSQLGNLSKYYGNSKVIVKPWVDLAARTENIIYSYSTEGTLPDGTKATMTATQTSAIIGFMNAVRTDDDSMKGLVPNTFPQSVKAPVPKDQADASKINPYQGATDQYTSKIQVRGNIHYTGPGMDRPLTGAAQPSSIYTNLTGIIPKIILTEGVMDNNAGMPKEILCKPEFTLQPYTKIGISNFEVSWCFFHFDGSWPDNYETQIPGALSSMEVPTSFYSQNVYALSQLTYKVGFISLCEIESVTSGGKALDPTKFTDFELSSYVMDPTTNEYDVSVTTSKTDLIAKAIGDFFSGPLGIIIILAVVAVLVIAVIYGIGKFRRH